MIAPGDTISQRYKVAQLVGSGAYSRVFLADDTALERRVALKAFEGVSSESRRARIQREARIFSQLNHRAIVRMYDVLLVTSDIVFVLEFVSGENFAQHLDRRVVPLTQIAEWTKELLEVVAYLHLVGVVHRDIKPSNILVEPSTMALRFTDFGTSKILEKEDIDEGLTVRGSLIGTLVYAAPEQLEGLEATPAADIYTCAIVLFQMLTRELPFRGPHRPPADEIVARAVSLRPSAPKPFFELIAAMLRENPRDRPTAEHALHNFAAQIAEIDLGGIHEQNALESLRQEKPATLDTGLMVSMIADSPTAKPTGFFADQAVRMNAYNDSVDFFRSHLNRDYENLLAEAKLAFVLWLVCVGIAFAIVVAGVILLWQGNITSGLITLGADTVILFIQNIFKQREDYYREEAKEKHAHLQMGSAWTLAVQSVDGIADAALREEKLAALSDELVKAFRSDSVRPITTAVPRRTKPKT